MNRIWMTIILGVASGLGLPGCDREVDTLEAFRERWSQSVTENDNTKLYHLLDSDSRRTITQQLEIMRGLDSASQRSVLDQLGGSRWNSLTRLSSEQYLRCSGAKPPTGNPQRCG